MDWRQFIHVGLSGEHLFGSYVTPLIFPSKGSCELHVLTTVDADGVPPSGDTPMTGISCNLTRSTIVPDTGTTAFTAAGDLLSTNSPGPLVRSVDLTILPRSSEIETSPHYHTLCEISSRIAPAEVYASASLALDIDSIVIGYSKSWRFATQLSSRLRAFKVMGTYIVCHSLAYAPHLPQKLPPTYLSEAL